MSVLALHDYFAKVHSENERVKCLFKGIIKMKIPHLLLLKQMD